MRSVFEQTFTDYEYLIIDGGSTDGTLEIIGQHASRLAYWISEPDAGLYDAMNKGLQVARGRYVWFMNAGDRIYDRDTMAKMFAAAPSDADVLYGDALFFDPTGRDLGLRSRVTPHALPARLTWQSFRFGMVVCHQSFLMRRSLAPEYDLSHRYSADVDWEIRCLKAAKRTVHTQLVLSRYLTGGFSRKNHRRSLQDRYIVLQKHFGVLPNLLNHAWILLRGVLFVLQKRRRY